jgi:acyl-ACP thioesterase
MLSLMMLTNSKICEKREAKLLVIDENTNDVVDAENEAIEFYEYAKLTKDIQEELRCSKTLDEVVEVARSHGFLVRKVDFLMNKHVWKDDFFPWSKLTTQETREFMHSAPPPINHPT